MIAGSAGNAPQVVAIHVVALYRRDDGRVVHLHTVQVFEGGRDVSREAAELGARASAQAIGHDVDSLGALHLDQAPPEPGPYRADVASGRLEALGARRRTPRESRRGRSGPGTPPAS